VQLMVAGQSKIIQNGVNCEGEFSNDTCFIFSF